MHMSRSPKRMKQRAASGLLGKELTRRSKGRCELCEGKDCPGCYELQPFPARPTHERTLMACLRCRTWLERSRVRPEQAHFLARAAWSNLPAVRLAAGRLLLQLSDTEIAWIHDALEAACIDPETLELYSESRGLA